VVAQFQTKTDSNRFVIVLAVMKPFEIYVK